MTNKDIRIFCCTPIETSSVHYLYARYLYSICKTFIKYLLILDSVYSIIFLQRFIDDRVSTFDRRLAFRKLCHFVFRTLIREISGIIKKSYSSRPSGNLGRLERRWHPVCEKYLSWTSCPQSANFISSRREPYWATFPCVDKVLITWMFNKFEKNEFKMHFSIFLANVLLYSATYW